MGRAFATTGLAGAAVLVLVTGLAGAQESDENLLEATDAPPPLQTLFYTPATRDALDEARLTGRDIGPREEKSTGALPPREVSLTVNGYVITSAGRRSAWVNGRKLESGEQFDGEVRVEVGGGEYVWMDTPDKGLVKVKPGESVSSMLQQSEAPAVTGSAMATADGGPGIESAPTTAAKVPQGIEERIRNIPEDYTLRDLLSALLAPGERPEDADRERAAGEDSVGAGPGVSTPLKEELTPPSPR